MRRPLRWSAKAVLSGIAGRLRVRDINDAIRELGQMVAMHTGASSSTFTKLTVLQEAVRVITDLENRLRGMGCPWRKGAVVRAARCVCMLCMKLGCAVCSAYLTAGIQCTFPDGLPFDAHCCHMGTAIKHSVPDRVKPSLIYNF